MPPTPPNDPPPDPLPGPEPGALPPGTRIGRFLVKDLLGQGGMGAVYRAWDPVLERNVALKAIRLGGDGRDEALARFRREAMALAQLNHPNVCQIHDWVEARGSAHIAMEFIEGATLGEAGRGMDLRKKLQAIRAVARALEAAHAKGIVHRDLKPGNVMVATSGGVKVLDFGLARLADAAQAEDHVTTGHVPVLPLAGTAADDTPTLAAPGSGAPAGSGSSDGDMTAVGTFVGTPSHASPEQLMGRRAGPPSDIFSLGLVAWELLAGGPAFPGEGRARAEATLRGVPNPLRARLPRRVAALLRAMLHPDPARRPTAAEVAAVLSRQLGGLPAPLWAAGAAVLLVASLCFAYLRLGRGVIADLARERPPRLVVMPFRNETGDPGLEALVSVGITELVSTGLRSSPSLAVVEPESVDRVASSLHLPNAGLAGPEAEGRIARALGAPLLLHGSLGTAGGDAFVFAYQLVDTSGRIRLQGTVRVPRTARFEPAPVVDPALHDLLRRVDPLHAETVQTPPVGTEVFAAYATGKARFQNGDFKGSEALLREAAMQAPAFSSAVSAYAACLRRLGSEAAPLAANWALMSARATGDRWAEVRALALKAYLAKDRGDLDASQTLREASLALARSIGDGDGEIVATNHLGLLAAERGQDREAQALYEQALDLSRASGDRIYQALIENNLANLALKRGELAAASARYQASLQIQQELGNRWGEALALNNLAVVALMTRDLPRAGYLLDRALAARAAVGDRAGQATCLRNLGILALMKGQPAEAADYHARAADLAREAGLRTIEAECRFYQADLARLAQRFGPAREDYQRVLALLPEGVTPGVRDNARAGLAECLARQPRPDLRKAQQLLDAVRAADGDSPYVLRARAWIEAAAGRRAEAREAVARALADPQRQAPEIRGELEALQRRWSGP